MSFWTIFPGFLLRIIKTHDLVTNRTLGSPLRCFIFWDIQILKLNSLENRENGHNMHQNGHIWYFLAIFVFGTFFALSEHNLCQMDALISTIWINGDRFIALKSPKNWKYGHIKYYNGHFWPFFKSFFWWSFRHTFQCPTELYGIHFDALYPEIFRILSRRL